MQNNDTEILKDSGKVLAKIAEHTPGGVLVFFPSYKLMNQCLEAWDNYGVMEEVTDHKKVFEEPKNPNKYPSTISAYYKQIYGKSRTYQGKPVNGAVLIGVCRGKISEGLDFSDSAARAVVIIGIPYPMLVDPKVILKKYHLDDLRQKGLGNSRQLITG